MSEESTCNSYGPKVGVHIIGYVCFDSRLFECPVTIHTCMHTLADTDSVLCEADDPNSIFVEAEMLLALPAIEGTSSEVGGEAGFDSMSLCSP